MVKSVSVLVTAAVCLLAAVCDFLAVPVASQIQIKPWAFMKDQLRYPAYTSEQKELVASQVENMLSVYVNRESKIHHYDVDPLPVIEKIRAEAATMSDKDFHESIVKLILSLRDFQQVFYYIIHVSTNYMLPVPYSCYFVSYPLQFDLISSSDLLNEPMVAVKSVTNVPPILLMIPQILKVQVGDILVSINGKTFKEMYEEYKHITGGANDFGGQRSVLNYMSFRVGANNLLPEETEVTYVLKRTVDAEETYTVTTPMIGIASDECIQMAEKLENGAPMDIDQEEEEEEEPAEDISTDEDMDEVVEPSDNGRVVTPLLPGFGKRRILSPKKQLDIMRHPYLDDMKMLFPPESTLKLFRTSEKIISWGIYEHKDIKLGVIRLESFMPTTDNTGLRSLEIIRGLLINQLKDTDCLVFDVRSNGGGIVTMADAILQFFTDQSEPTRARALVSPINEKLFLETFLGGGGWSEAYRQVKEGDTYTPTVSFAGKDELKKFGQAYLKPVGVLTNANCYSSCDLFTANMQDAKAAVIFGEDPTTGAGGANVVDLAGFFANFLPETFQRLPFGQNMRVGWRQTVRTGVNDGKLVEDIGVLSDIVVRPQPTDLWYNQSSASQFDTIASHLAELGRKDGRSYTSLLVEPQAMSDSEIGSPVKFDISVSWLTKVELLYENQVKGTLEIPKSETRSQVVLASETVADKATIERYAISGYNDQGTKIATVYRDVRFVPPKSAYLTIQANETVDFDFNLKEASYAAVYNYHGTNDAEGWNVVDNALVVHDGTTYADNSETSVNFFVNFGADTHPSVRIQAEIDTEVDCDFLSLAVAHSKRGHIVLLNEAGKKTIDETFALERFAGMENVEFELKFMSDPMIHVGPVRVTGITFSA